MRCSDPLDLDPLGPVGIADIAATTEPLALDPLSPLSARAGETDATRDSTRHSPGRDQAHAGSKVPA
jgi:hypothetical protein